MVGNFFGKAVSLWHFQASFGERWELDARGLA